MKVAEGVFKTLFKLGALEEKVSELQSESRQIREKCESMMERIVRLESDYGHLKTNVKNEILNEIKSELVRVQTLLDAEGKGLLDTKGKK